MTLQTEVEEEKEGQKENFIKENNGLQSPNNNQV
jgi:hypothetical protein